MILGIGSDLVDIRRIQKILDRQGKRFIARCFAPKEQIYEPLDPCAAGHYAKRFAAKEAAAKAIGTGIARGVYLKDIVVTNNPTGRPEIILQGRTAEVASQDVCIHVSLSDEPPYALAFVVIEKIIR